MKEKIKKAIKIIKDSKETHVDWANFLSENPEDDRSEYVGDEKFHRECIEEYNYVLDVLNNLLADIPFGIKEHDDGAPDHSGKFGHYCAEWDGLYICKDCEEFQACTCFKTKDYIEYLEEDRNKWKNKYKSLKRNRKEQK